MRDHIVGSCIVYFERQKELLFFFFFDITKAGIIFERTRRGLRTSLKQ
jgi:hypothetical protein